VYYDLILDQDVERGYFAWCGEVTQKGTVGAEVMTGYCERKGAAVDWLRLLVGKLGWTPKWDGLTDKTEKGGERGFAVTAWPERDE